MGAEIVREADISVCSRDQLEPGAAAVAVAEFGIVVWWVSFRSRSGEGSAPASTSCCGRAERNPFG